MNSKPYPQIPIFIALLLLMICLGSGCAMQQTTRGTGNAASMEKAFAPKTEVYRPKGPSQMRQTVQDPEERMIHYNGYLKLRATNPDDVIESAIQLATSAGGYVERRDSTTVTLRVPVARFNDTLARVEKLGDVLEKSVTVEDITDAFMDIDLRLKIAEKTRNRLMELLEKADTEEAKIKLLKEIQRLNEEIENLTNQKNTLSSLANYSRLTLALVPRQVFSGRSADDDVTEFKWIYSLSPFRRDIAMQGELLKFRTPKEMVALDKKDLWISESADGTIFWASRRLNNPKGNTDFWFEAIRYRLEPEFTKSEVKQLGNFKVLRLVQGDEQSYIYLVGVHADEKWIELVEVYFPSTDQETRYGEAVFDSIAKDAE